MVRCQRYVWNHFNITDAGEESIRTNKRVRCPPCLSLRSSCLPFFESGDKKSPFSNFAEQTFLHHLQLSVLQHYEKTGFCVRDVQMSSLAAKLPPVPRWQDACPWFYVFYLQISQTSLCHWNRTRESFARSLISRFHQHIVTFSACKPFSPSATSNSTFWPSCNVRNPLASIELSVYKDILTFLPTDKPESFLVVKPFHGSSFTFCHFWYSLIIMI